LAFQRCLPGVEIGRAGDDVEQPLGEYRAQGAVGAESTFGVVLRGDEIATQVVAAGQPCPG
jgi:hypothetical protein